jgi:hypothetical protein
VEAACTSETSATHPTSTWCNPPRVELKSVNYRETVALLHDEENRSRGRSLCGPTSLPSVDIFLGILYRCWALMLFRGGRQVPCLFHGLDCGPCRLVSRWFGVTRCYVTSGLFFFCLWAANRSVHPASLCEVFKPPTLLFTAQQEVPQVSLANSVWSRSNRTFMLG